MTRTLNSLVLLLLIVRSVGAQTLPDEPKCTAPGEGKLQLTREDTTILGLTIGASLKTVQAKLGAAKSLPTHGNASASNTICYVSPDDGTVVTFGAGAMGGFTDVTEFALWSRDAKFPNTSMCTRSTSVSASLATPSGIRLGLEEADLTKIMGKTPTNRRDRTSYEFLCARRMTKAEAERFSNDGSKDDPYFDLTSSATIHFLNGRTSRIAVYKGESY